MAIALRSLPLNALRSFDAASRHLSFASAAAELSVTPAAVSAQIRRLEEWVGAPLFVRGHRSITLSATGERLAPRLTSVFLDLERLLTETAAIDVDVLQVSTIQSFAAKWLAPRVGSFVTRHPSLRLRVVGEDRQVDLERDGVDVALRYGDGEYPGMHCELIARAAASPVCTPELAERFPDPQTIPPDLLLRDESALVAPGLPTWEAWLGPAAGPRQEIGGVLFRNAHVALAAALAGQGFALGITPLVDDDVAAGRLVRPYARELTSPFGFWFVCRSDRLAEPKITAFRDWVMSAR